MHHQGVKLSESSEVERVYRDHGERLWRAVVLYCGDPEIASDAVAEAFSQALAHEPSIQDLASWVWRVSFRLASRELRGHRSREAIPEGSYQMPDPLPEVAAALASLSPKQRGSVILHHYAGYPVTEVARILHSTPAAVGVHLHRGRARLRKLLEDLDE